MRVSNLPLVLALLSSPLYAVPCDKPGFDPKAWTDAPVPTVDAHDQKLIDFMQNPTRPDGSRQTEWKTDAIVIAYKDKIELEAYFNNYGPTKKHLLWSGTKSIFNALTGIAVADGKLDLNKSVADYLPRFPHLKEVKVDHLLSYSSGLDWKETYEEHLLPQQSSITNLLYGLGPRSIEKALLPYRPRHRPGSHWYYSGGDTAFLSLILKSIYGAEYKEMPWQRLFEPLGIQSAVMEADAEGTYYGPTSSYMIARDFLRFGELYLHDGCVAGEALLPRKGSIPGFTQLSWTELAMAPTEAVLTHIKGKVPWPDQTGRHFWINLPSDQSGKAPPYAKAPVNILIAMGHWGQRLYIIPAWNMVVVRFADDRSAEFWPEDHFFAQLASWREAKGFL
ncbi:serine hydrolase domain-containing protein [Oligoflexus tunisiensis]|uniref:serine hydrolase domain-containing protein n=1 Tax=Oligoflexus tunisiensis TaxID=708132 RepID=UPI00159F2225|nr:serine hydrolase [Oligoflexus tunisiensis]